VLASTTGLTGSLIFYDYVPGMCFVPGTLYNVTICKALLIKVYVA